MNEEIDDAGAFLQDFTAVSDWEILILRIEEVISLWKLSKVPKEPPLCSGDLKKFDWKIYKETIDVQGFFFSLFHYKLDIQDGNNKQNMDVLEETERHSQVILDLRNDKNDFNFIFNSENNIPMLVSWYGLRDFVLLQCAGGKDIKANDVKIILSAINIAMNNTGCQVPIFVQCLDSWQEYFIGIFDYKDVCIKFDSIHLQKIPGQCHYLVGLVDIFKGKIASPVPLDSVQISAQFTYDLTDATSSLWMQEPPDFEFLQGKTLGISNYSTLPFGLISDPIKNLYLCVSWLRLAEDTIVDSHTYSDLNPLLAPFWKLTVEFSKNTSSLLHKFLETFINLHKYKMTIKTFLNDVYDTSESLSGSLPIPKLIQNNFKCEGEPVLAEALYYNTIPYDTMKTILHFIFLDNTLESESDRNGAFTLHDECLKAGQVYDLIWRLGVLSAHMAQVMEDPHAVAHVWYEFIQELRYKWDNAIIINRVMDGFPNSRNSLLHQKMQMLNVCIERRKAREAAAFEGANKSDDSSAESDDEFFECTEETADVESDAKKNPAWNKPIGRLAKFENKTLIESGEQIYIPITQEPVPKTEDQLEEDAEVMLTLDVGPSRSETIARIMSASLLSDMESFMAANPGAIFEDFIRWYSPRDWIEDDSSDDSRKGHLSTRMLIPNNMWVEVWKSAKPVAAKRQKRLFDDTKEGEKILHFLESRSVSEIVELLMPSIIQAVIEKLGQECIKSSELPELESSYKLLKSSAIKLTREKASVEKYKRLLQQIVVIESVISQLDSLKMKLNYTDKNITEDTAKQFLKELVKEGESKVPDHSKSELRSKISKLFQGINDEISQGSTQREKFSTPSQKEFVLRVNARRPSAYSTPTLQMMRAIIRQNSCRLLGAFSEDTVFT